MSSSLRFDAILFDLDGTLADSAADIRDALVAAFRAIDVEMGSRLTALIDGSPLEEIFAVAIPNGTPRERETFIEAYRAAYDQGRDGQTSLFPGVRETLDTLARLSGRPRLAVATSKRTVTARAMLERLEIAPHFDVVWGSGASPMPAKPAPDLLLTVARELGVEPARALMVGDTLRDVVAGQRAGMRTAAVTYGLGPADQLMQARPDYVLEEFDELLLLLGESA